MGKMIIVSNRLPINSTGRGDKGLLQISAGEYASGLLNQFDFNKEEFLWFGWPGFSVPEAEGRAEMIVSLKEKGMVPVFLDQNEAEQFYNGFCNETLWPTYHYFTQYIAFDDELWEVYKMVNDRYCQAILKKAQPGDTVWIHDYHLLLLPQMLKDQLPDLKIGFFQHIPFPSYEIFRVLPWRDEILKGMCGADLVGFNTYDDMRHFLSSVGRILGYSHEAGFIHTPNHLVNVDSFPLGVNYDKFQEAANSSEVCELVDQYKKELGSQKLVLTSDRLDYSKGLLQRLKAFDLLIDNHPEYLEKVSMVMIVMPSRTAVPEYQELKEKIDTLVGRINSKYSSLDWMPIHYFYRRLSFTELVAYYRVSSVALVTPLRDGMNLVCKEFIASRISGDGVLVLSEMAGASKELQEAIIVNPNNIKMMEKAIYSALNCPLQLQQKKMKIMQRTVKKYDVFHWSKIFLSSLDKVVHKQQKLKSRALGSKEISQLKQDFEGAEKPVIFLDYDGALIDYKDQPEEALPDKQVINILKELGKNAEIVIVSGRDKSTLEKWLDGTPVHIMAEHGVYWRYRDTKNWVTKVELVNDWKAAFRKEMDEFVERTPGTFVEEKEHSLVWHYRKVESGLGNLRKRELFSHLKYVARGHQLQVLEGNRALEIKKPDISKSKACLEFLENQPYDFVLVIGDNWTDEETFRKLSPNAVTVRVGYTYTRAKYNLQNHFQVREFLKGLCLKNSNFTQGVNLV
ncbi:bifunctional alpha,alpha-trehalose-phosphate synthase (UDP-forming)/trehalose-phosphatase [Litoribacter populi]|uniref:bifunctional alpha,alpha-trehalose-phosphate synthase (UDP-forming)/trehalose-phosphatase n=1 Tax=Litoribacter populi TaxID=2598460 RepID=UPI00117E1EDD|nr:bifunctional alpha,alpha-trehalose-phosphate synthase (UDP-forming)/trehalose-phosphatase [Litoribacter populi]